MADKIDCIDTSTTIEHVTHRIVTEIKDHLVDFQLKLAQEILASLMLQRIENKFDPTPVEIQLADLNSRRTGMTTGVVIAALAAAMNFKQKVVIVTCHPDANENTRAFLIEVCKVAQISFLKAVGETAWRFFGYDGEELFIRVEDSDSITSGESETIYIYDCPMDFKAAVVQGELLLKGTTKSEVFIVNRVNK